MKGKRKKVHKALVDGKKNRLGVEKKGDGEVELSSKICTFITLNIYGCS